MKKKMITALLASAMVLSLVACGGGGTDSNGGGDTSSSGSGTSSSSDSNKLTVWAWDQNFNIKAIETALIVGVICGCYSSVCIAGCLWYDLKNALDKRKAKKTSK